MRRLLPALVLASVLHGQKLVVVAGPCTAGDACYVKYAIANDSTAPLRLPDPDPDGDHAPRFFLRAPGVAAEQAVTGSRDMPARTITLKPGEKAEFAFRLDERVALRPGGYEIRAVLDGVGAKLESPRVRFAVSAPQPLAFGIPIELNLPDANRVIVSWIAAGPGGGRQYMEQALTRDADSASVRRDDVVSRTALPADARELTTARSGVFVKEKQPLRWIFWRAGDTVYAKGPPAMSPDRVTLPPGTGPLLDRPVMGSFHRADLFYLGGTERQPELIVVRFCDPVATPTEKSRIVATLRLPGDARGGAVAIAIDATNQTTDLRHIVIAGVAAGQVTLHHTTLNWQGDLSPLRQVALDLPGKPLFRPLEQGAAALVVGPGELRVAIAGTAAADARRPALLTVSLNQAARGAVMRQFDSPAAVAAGRASVGASAAAAVWWLANGDVVTSAGGGALSTPAAPPGPVGGWLRALVWLRDGPFLVHFGSSGARLVPLGNPSNR